MFFLVINEDFFKFVGKSQNEEEENDDEPSTHPQKKKRGRPPIKVDNDVNLNKPRVTRSGRICKNSIKLVDFDTSK